MNEILDEEAELLVIPDSTPNTAAHDPGLGKKKQWAENVPVINEAKRLKRKILIRNMIIVACILVILAIVLPVSLLSKQNQTATSTATTTPALPLEPLSISIPQQLSFGRSSAQHPISVELPAKFATPDCQAAIELYSDQKCGIKAQASVSGDVASCATGNATFSNFTVYTPGSYYVEIAVGQYASACPENSTDVVIDTSTSISSFNSIPLVTTNIGALVNTISGSYSAATGLMSLLSNQIATSPANTMSANGQATNSVNQIMATTGQAQTISATGTSPGQSPTSSPVQILGTSYLRIPQMMGVGYKLPPQYALTAQLLPSFVSPICNATINLYSDNQCSHLVYPPVTGDSVSCASGNATFSNFTIMTNGTFYIQLAVGQAVTPCPINATVFIIPNLAPQNNYNASIALPNPLYSGVPFTPSIVLSSSSSSVANITVYLGAYSDNVCNTVAPGTVTNGVGITDNIGRAIFPNFMYVGTGTVYFRFYNNGLFGYCTWGATISAAPPTSTGATITVPPTSTVPLQTGANNVPATSTSQSAPSSTAPPFVWVIAYVPGIVTAGNLAQMSIEAFNAPFSHYSGPNCFATFNLYRDSNCTNIIPGTYANNSCAGNGIASFSQVFNKSSVFYAMGTANGQNSTCSVSVTVQPTTNYQFSWVVYPPANATQGHNISPFSLLVTDEYGNNITTGTFIIRAYTDNACQNSIMLFSTPSVNLNALNFLAQLLVPMGMTSKLDEKTKLLELSESIPTILQSKPVADSDSHWADKVPVVNEEKRRKRRKILWMCIFIFIVLVLLAIILPLAILGNSRPGNSIDAFPAQITVGTAVNPAPSAIIPSSAVEVNCIASIRWNIDSNCATTANPVTSGSQVSCSSGDAIFSNLILYSPGTFYPQIAVGGNPLSPCPKTPSEVIGYDNNISIMLGLLSTVVAGSLISPMVTVQENGAGVPNSSIQILIYSDSNCSTPVINAFSMSLGVTSSSGVGDFGQSYFTKPGTYYAVAVASKGVSSCTGPFVVTSSTFSQPYSPSQSGSLTQQNSLFSDSQITPGVTLYNSLLSTNIQASVSINVVPSLATANTLISNAAVTVSPSFPNSAATVVGSNPSSVTAAPFSTATPAISNLNSLSSVGVSYPSSWTAGMALPIRVYGLSGLNYYTSSNCTTYLWIFSDSSCTTLVPGSAASLPCSGGNYTNYPNNNITKIGGYYIIGGVDGVNSSCATGVMRIIPDAASTIIWNYYPPSFTFPNQIFSPPVSGTLVDIYGNPITATAATISLNYYIDSTCMHGPSVGFGTNNNVQLDTTSGNVTFSSFSFNAQATLYWQISNYPILSTCYGPTAISDPFSTISWFIQPSGGTAGRYWSQPPVVHSTDIFNAPENGGSLSVSIFTDSSCSVPASNGSVYTNTAVTSGGSTSFLYLNITRVGTYYAMASSSNVSSPCSSSFSITGNLPASVSWTTNIGGGQYYSGNNVYFSTQPSAQVLDKFGNNATGMGYTCLISFYSDNTCGTIISGSSYIGNSVSMGSTGSCAFTHLGYLANGNFYSMIKVSSGSYVYYSPCSAMFTLATESYNLTWVNHPSSSQTHGVAFTPAVSVTIYNVWNQLVSNGLSVSASFFSDSGCMSASVHSFSNTATTTANGYANFTSISTASAATYYIRISYSTFYSSCYGPITVS
ncbi:hypothetical protein HDV06_002781 [Boothiomyces sp. JEL0866]|nr:hypothetical protein HDV06_002781 [Boothiomyces sp. JEL0866]